MKKLLYTLLIVGLFSCDENTETPECPGNASCLPTEQMMKNDLDSARAEILDFIKASSCSDTVQCAFMGLGSKPCGGPWEYIVYSTAVDTAQLNDWVTTYNEMEASYNEVYGKGSDCAIAIAPDSVVCESTGCVAYHEGMSFSDGVCCE